MRLHEYRVHFRAATLILALVVASPALGTLLVPPRTEFFTEFWILGSNHGAEGYPFNITRNRNYKVFLGIRDNLGYCAYYVVEVKFRNQTEPAPNSINRTSSGLPSLLNITAFVADEETWELPLTFSLDYSYDEALTPVKLYSMSLNDVSFDVRNCTIALDLNDNGFLGNLFFELWIYDAETSRFRYHERFVGLWFNLTNS